MKKNQQGFSLIELLIVLAITAGLLSNVAPRLNNVLKGLQLKNLTREVMASLNTTRSQAISKGQEAVWLLDLEQRYFQYGTKKKSVSYSDDIDVTLITASKEQLSNTVASIRFFPDGSATGGEVILAQGNRNYSIQIDWLTGRIKLYD